MQERPKWAGMDREIFMEDEKYKRDEKVFQESNGINKDLILFRAHDTHSLNNNVSFFYVYPIFHILFLILVTQRESREIIRFLLQQRSVLKS